MLTVALCLAALLCGAYGQDTVLINSTLLTGQVNETVYFACDTQETDGGAVVTVEVYNNGAFLNFVDARLMRTEGGTSALYSFGPLRTEDNGTMLRCTGLVDQSPSVPATISVTIPPVITRVSPMGDSVVEREGVAVTVMLNVTGNPRPQYTWTRNGGPLPTNGVTAALESITFNPTSRNHSGMYTLVASNSAGNDSHSFTLNVQYPPEFINAPYQRGTVNCTEGVTTFECAAYPGASTVMFNCAADGNPTPTVDISRPGQNITNATNPTINITSVDNEDRGLYSCIASSSEFPQDNIARSFRLYVGGPAIPVSNARTSNIEGVVYAVWTYDNAANAVPGRYFNVTVFQGDTQIGDPIQVPITQRNATVPANRLVRGQMYTVEVVVINLQGDSEAITSEEFTFSGSTIGVSVSNLLTLLLVVGVMFALL